VAFKPAAGGWGLNSVAAQDRQITRPRGIPQAMASSNRSLQHRSDLRCCACSEKGPIEKHVQFWVLMGQGSMLTLCALGTRKECQRCLVKYTYEEQAATRGE
jgi:hypothetical protein